MARATIDYGIDLGTTNSKIAILSGTVPEVIPNKDGSLLTPSAIWFDKRGKQYVGKVAKEHRFDDPDNAADEFKLRMGEQWQKTFQRTGRKMLPEEMSAEVLKSLKADVRTNKGEDLQAAVITVPASFYLPHCEATKRAAELAGLSVCPLLQEPVAAAVAYGFQSSSDKVFWLVYDFGGGTFDAAVIQVRDGVIQVVNHAGDDYLGGKNIDWDIVEKLLLPKLTRERCLTDFNRGNPKWRSAFAKLKGKAEEAKIQVSRTQQPAEIWIEDLCSADKGDSVDFEYEVTSAQLERIIAPWVAQSVVLCRTALQEKGLSGHDMEKMIVVGGSSLFRWLQEAVSAELGVSLELTIDPMTVVARGASVFAGSQRLDAPATTAAEGVYSIQLEYDPIGSDTEPPVGARVLPPAGASLVGLRVEITELRSRWKSGNIAVGANGVFTTEVHAERGRKCEYEIVLTDARGTMLPCTPDRFAYTVGMVITSPPLTHDVGVADANNKPIWFFRKGDALPARATRVLHTTVPLRKNAPPGDDNVIRIPVFEGVNRTKADRNRLIGKLEIWPGDAKVKRDVALGSDVEVTIEIDPSRTTTTKAFIPVLDEEFENIFKPHTTPKEALTLRQELHEEVERLNSLRQKAEEVADAKAEAALAHIEREQTVEIAQRQVAAAQQDPDALGEAGKKLLDVKTAGDSVEGALEWPVLVQEAREMMVAAREVVEAHGRSDEKEQLHRLGAEIEKAITEDRPELLRACLDSLQELVSGVWVRQPALWVGYRDYLNERRSSMRDQAAAEQLFGQAQKAINDNDLEALKASVRQLVGLLPADERAAAEARGKFGGTIIAE